MRVVFTEAVESDAAAIAALRNSAADHLTSRFGKGHWSGHVTERGVRSAMRNAKLVVAGARLRIIGLRAGGGPGVEFLHYLSPRDGRANESRPNDLAHWQTSLTVGDVDGIARRLRQAEIPFISSEVVNVGGLGKAVMVRDPDGHAIRLVESIR